MSDTPENPPKMRAMNFTLSSLEVAMLEQLVQWRHHSDPKSGSMTVRECIREAYERDKAAREPAS